MHKSHSKRETFPPLGDLTKLLHQEITKFDRCFIIVDALDAILDEPKRLQLLEILAHAKVSVMVTSRFLDSIEDLFAGEVSCDGCEEENIYSIFHCKQCADYSFDLCESCHSKGLNCPNEGQYAVKRFSAYTIDIRATQSDVRNYVHWHIDHEARLLERVTKKRALREEIAAT